MKANTKNASTKRAEKKQINIKWNSRLFFQLGIIVSLLFVFFVMQMDFEKKTMVVKNTTAKGITEPPMITYVLDVDMPKPQAEKVKVKPKQPVQKIVKSNEFVVKPNSSTDIETPVLPTDAPEIESPTIPISLPVVDKPEGPKSLNNVEFVPVFPGCEMLGTNAEKIECMSSKINSFINKNFRTELLENLQSNETHRVYVNFKIDANGYVTDVMANSHDMKLKNEAQRVIAGLPNMRPGKQGDKNVAVLYTVPIVFKIQ